MDVGIFKKSKNKSLYELCYPFPHIGNSFPRIHNLLPWFTNLILEDMNQIDKIIGL